MVKFIVDGQVTSSYREGAQIEYTIQGLLFAQDMLKGEGMDMSPGPLGHIPSHDLVELCKRLIQTRRSPRTPSLLHL